MAFLSQSSVAAADQFSSAAALTQGGGASAFSVCQFWDLTAGGPLVFVFFFFLFFFFFLPLPL